MWASKHRRIFFTILPILFLQILSIDVSAKDLNERQAIVLSKTVMSPIYIRNDSDLIRQAQQNGWPGNGSPTNPYLIKDYYIKANRSYCIRIENTRLHVSIVNCTLEDAYYYGVLPYGYAIILSNVSNVTVDRNNIYNSGGGIFLSKSSFCTIKNNIINNISSTEPEYRVNNGIWLTNTVMCILESNQISKCRAHGILLYNVTHTVVERNNIYDCRESGICGNDIILYSDGSLIFCNFRGNVIRNTRAGISLYSASTCNIESNEISKCRQGIVLYKALYVVVEKNNIYECTSSRISCFEGLISVVKDNKIDQDVTDGAAIYGSNSKNISIISNIITEAITGIYLYYSTNNTLRENVLVKCGIVLDGDISTWTSQLIDSSNEVNGKPVLYKVSAIGENITGTYGQIIIANSKNVVIRDLEISETSRGLQVGFSNSIAIQNCSLYRNILSGIYFSYTKDSVVRSTILSENGMGIHIYGSMANKIYENRLINNTYGLYLYNSDENMIFNNYIAESSQVGILIEVNSESNEVFLNMICNNNYGLSISSYEAAKIYRNKINNNRYGLHIFSSLWNEIYENEFTNNTYGLYLDYSDENKIYNNYVSESSNVGIYLINSNENEIFLNRICRNKGYGVAITGRSYYNKIYRNIFIDNAQYKKGLIGKSQAYDSAGRNYWFIESSREGNYWSNWDGNGWGTPEAYPIDGGAGAYDKYPLSSPTPEISYIFIVLALTVIIISRLCPLKPS